MQCDKCKDGFYGLSEEGCKPCDCNKAGIEHGSHCDKETGQCVCKPNHAGRRCMLCKCDQQGSVAGTQCDMETGQCVCKSNYTGRDCSECNIGFCGAMLSVYGT